MGRVNGIRSFNVDIHLLSHIKGSVLVLNPVNDLENARVHALGTITGERLLGDHIGLEADELQGNSYRTVSTRRRRRWCPAAHTPGIVLGKSPPLHVLVTNRPFVGNAFDQSHLHLGIRQICLGLTHALFGRWNVFGTRFLFELGQACLSPL
jgi:hypothetical protein